MRGSQNVFRVVELSGFFLDWNGGGGEREEKRRGAFFFFFFIFFFLYLFISFYFYFFRCLSFSSKNRCFLVKVGEREESGGEDFTAGGGGGVREVEKEKDKGKEEEKKGDGCGGERAETISLNSSCRRKMEKGEGSRRGCWVGEDETRSGSL